MRVVRNTMYKPPTMVPITVVMRESDLTQPFERSVKELSDPAAVPGLFFVVDVFEVDADTDIAVASRLAAERQKARDQEERDMATLYYWDEGALAHVTPGGVLAASKPTPLTVDQIEYTLKLLAHSPQYRGQTVMSISKDQRFVEMKGGKTVVREIT